MFRPPTRAWLAVVAIFVAASAAADDTPFEFQQGDRVIFLGNTFAERMRQFSYFETLLLERFPDKELTFRNLGWSADEVDLRPRPLDFGDIHQHLADKAADVIFVLYGQNESFEGEAGLPKFEEDLAELLDELLAHSYNGESPPRLVLVSPVPQEPIGVSPALLDLGQRNRDVRRYHEAMARVAESKGIQYIDLFTPLSWRGEEAPRLTFNGIHFTDFGYWTVAPMMLSGLGYEPEPIRVTVDAQSGNATAKPGKVEVESSGEGRWALTVEPAFLPYLPGPNSVPSESLVVSANGLAPGRYALQSGGITLAEADQSAWADGIALANTEAHARAQRLREAAVYKNQLFFDRWRAVNGYYIYGGRKEPFGVISFPPEMQRFDSRIAEFDQQLHQLAQPTPLEFELVRIGD